MSYLVKLIIGVLYPDEEWLDWTKCNLEKKLGKVERTIKGIPFTYTDYYKDISPNLFKAFFSFEGLRFAEKLADWKILTCDIEATSGESRRINIDPGYLNGARLVLASTKDHAHRIYLRDGIFAEVTLRYKGKKWVPFDYTFPDFRSGLYDGFLSIVRADWLKEMKAYKEDE